MVTNPSLSGLRGFGGKSKPASGALTRRAGHCSIFGFAISGVTREFSEQYALGASQTLGAVPFRTCGWAWNAECGSQAARIRSAQWLGSSERPPLAI